VQVHAGNHRATVASPGRRASLRALAYPCGFLFTAAPSEEAVSKQRRERAALVDTGVSRLAAIHPRHPGKLVASAPDSKVSNGVQIIGAAARSGRLATLAMYSNGAGTQSPQTRAALRCAALRMPVTEAG